MTLTYQTKGSTETKEVRVVFDPPLAGYEEVKPRLMNMKGEAEEELGMVRVHARLFSLVRISMPNPRRARTL